MNIIQEKLREVIEQGNLSSVHRLSSVLDTSDHNDESDDDISVEEEDENKQIPKQLYDMHEESAAVAMEKKSEDKIPKKASKKKKHWIENVRGQSGARLARKGISRAKPHGKMKIGSFANKSKPRQPRRNKNVCAF